MTVSDDKGVVPIRSPETDEAWIERIRAACRGELEAYGLSHAQAAHEIGEGVSAGTMSGWLSGAYKGNVAAVTRRIETWLDTRRDVRARSLDAAGLDRHARLGVTEEVHAVCARAQAASELCLIHGRPGAGKSWAAERYCATRTAAWHIQMTAVVSTLTGMLTRISEEIGAGSHANRYAEFAEKRVIHRIRDRRALLVIDEAHHLKPRLLDELRCIRDVARCGVVLIGGDELWTTLSGSPKCDQIVGRLAIRLPVSMPTSADVSVLAAGVLGREPGPKELRLLTAAAHGPGGFHALRRCLARAWMIAKARDADEIGTDDLALAQEAA